MALPPRVKYVFKSGEKISSGIQPTTASLNDCSGISNLALSNEIGAGVGVKVTVGENVGVNVGVIVGVIVGVDVEVLVAEGVAVDIGKLLAPQLAIIRLKMVTMKTAIFFHIIAFQYVREFQT